MNRVSPTGTPGRCCVFFAVPEEARPFRKLFPESSPSKGDSLLRAIVTGMGAASAKKHARIHLESFRPDRVITAGFAGALRKEHRNGDLVLDADDSFIPPPEWSRAGWIRRGRFLCVPRLAATAAAKHEWARSSGADAIEMESEVIRSICHSMGIPSATLRVISDELDEDLPLDFSQFMDEQQRMRWMALFGYITKHPEVIPQLMAFRRRLADAAGRLALALGEACGRPAIK